MRFSTTSRAGQARTILGQLILAGLLLLSGWSGAGAAPLSPPATPAPGLPNLVPTFLGVNPVGSNRPNIMHPLVFNMAVANTGNASVPAGSVLPFDIYVNPMQPPGPGDPGTYTGTLTLSSDLQPGQTVLWQMTPITITTAGPMDSYGWVNRDQSIPESNYGDNLIGPSHDCVAMGDGQTFSDVPPGTYYYRAVEALAGCQLGISGYGDGTFRPFNPTTRSQLTKIVVLSDRLPLYTPPGGAYTFADVMPDFPFFTYIETAAHLGMVSGYTCGGPGEPCDAQQRPYFRPYGFVTRAQLTKLIVIAAGWPLINPPTATFADVLPGSAFYQVVETARCHGIVSGYACGPAGQGCDPQQRPYFRPGGTAPRGQIAKAVYMALESGHTCVAP